MGQWIALFPTLKRITCQNAKSDHTRYSHDTDGMTEESRHPTLPRIRTGIARPVWHTFRHGKRLGACVCVSGTRNDWTGRFGRSWATRWCRCWETAVLLRAVPERRQERRRIRGRIRASHIGIPHRNGSIGDSREAGEPRKYTPPLPHRSWFSMVQISTGAKFVRSSGFCRLGIWDSNLVQYGYSVFAK